MRRAGVATAFVAMAAAGALAGQMLVASAEATALRGVTGAATWAGAGAASTVVSANVSANASTAPSTDRTGGYRVQARLAREKVRRGDQDRGVRRIEHVRELQYRLRWANVYNGPVTGYFGDRTHRAVKRFQRRAGITVTGVSERRTWRALLERTVRHRGALPRKCTNGKGWHACYDRSRHQVTLWHKGKLRNTWLVRGGGRGYETRTGTFAVYYRNRDHVSSLYGSPMPYSQFFSGGQAFHGSTFMTDPFSGHSHGCINMYIEDARQLWLLTHDKRLKVHNYGAWS